MAYWPRSKDSWQRERTEATTLLYDNRRYWGLTKATVHNMDAEESCGRNGEGKDMFSLFETRECVDLFHSSFSINIVHNVPRKDFLSCL